MEKNILDKKILQKEIQDQTFRTFRSLLRKGIGSRSQSEFASEVGISRVTLNRMLNSGTISKPSRDLLFTFSRHIVSVTYQEFLLSCGYEMDDIHVIAGKNVEYLQQALTGCMGKVVSQPSDLIEVINGLYEGTIAHLSLKGNWKIPMEADQVFRCLCHWSMTPYDCLTLFALAFTEAKSGKLILTGFMTGEQLIPYIAKEVDLPKNSFVELDKLHSTFIRDIQLHPYQISQEPTAEEKFLKSILGPQKENCFINTVPAFGFCWEENPDSEKIRNFLFSNSSFFCDKIGNQKLLDEIAAGEDPNLVLYDFENADRDGLEPKYVLDYIVEDGPGAAVAYVLTRTTGHIFYHIREKVDNISVIVCKIDPETNIPRDLLWLVYLAVKELGIQKFGRIYLPIYTEITNSELYDLKTFHFE